MGVRCSRGCGGFRGCGDKPVISMLLTPGFH